MEKNNCTTINELKTTCNEVDGSEWEGVFYNVEKGTYRLFGLHQFLNEKPDLCLLAENIGDYQTAIKETFDEIGLDDNDIGGPGGNHLKLIVVDEVGFICYETEYRNF